MRWWDAQGNLLLTGEERAEQERQEKEIAQTRAHLAEERADRLAARLRAMGINLDTEEI